MIKQDTEITTGTILVKRGGWSMVLYDFFEIVDVTAKQVKLYELQKRAVNIEDCMRFSVVPENKYKIEHGEHEPKIIRVSKEKLRIQYSLYNSQEEYKEDHAD